MQIGNIPNELLLNIFCYLDYKDLFSASLVCKKWKGIYNEESLWKRQCNNYIDDISPIEGSYKKRFNVIRNIITGYASITSSDISCEEWHVNSNTVVNKNGDCIRLYQHKNNYIITNVLTGHEQCLKFPDNVKIITFYTSNNFYVFIDDVGNIYVYDNTSFNPVYIIDSTITDLKPNENTKIYYNESIDEIIIIHGNFITVINVSESCIKHKINVVNILDNFIGSNWSNRWYQDIFYFKSTQNHIILQTYSNPVHQITLSLNKNTSMLVSIDDDTDYKCIDTYKNYIVTISNNNKNCKITTYRDMGNNIDLLYEIEPFSPPFGTYHSKLIINDKLLYVNKNGCLYIFKLDTGEKISSIKHKYNRIDISTNGQILLIKNIKGDPKTLLEATYHSIDFTKPLSKIFSPSNIISSLEKTNHCSLM